MIIEWLDRIDTQCFYWINHHHCVFTDWLMWGASQTWSWLMVLLIFFFVVTLRYDPKRWWLVLLGIGLCFLLSDRISVLCFKNVVCRLRPCHALEDVVMFKTSCGGLYGFISSHAANVFSLAMFLSMRYVHKNGLPRKKTQNVDGPTPISTPSNSNWIIPSVLFFWALLVGYSRPYLGKHYPGDILCGALVGIGLGALVFFLTRKLEVAIDHRKQQKV